MNSGVAALACRFCVQFGREEGGKRPALRTVKTFTPTWRTDTFLQHLKVQHADKWAHYSASSVEERKALFENNGTPFVNTLPSHLDTGDPTFFWIKKEIVKDVIGCLLFDPAECEDQDLSADRMLRSFKKYCEGNFHIKYKVTIKKVTAFDLSLSYIGAGLSFRQVTTVLHETWKRTGLSKLRSVSEGDMADFARVAVAINLQPISDLLSNPKCWAYSTEFDGATVQGRSFLDVRVRLCSNGVIENLHILAVPLRVSHTGLAMESVISRLMAALCVNYWKKKSL
jgi:hypothetical protein